MCYARACQRVSLIRTVQLLETSREVIGRKRDVDDEVTAQSFFVNIVWTLRDANNLLTVHVWHKHDRSRHTILLAFDAPSQDTFLDDASAEPQQDDSFGAEVWLAQGA